MDNQYIGCGGGGHLNQCTVYFFANFHSQKGYTRKKINQEI